MLDDEEEEGKHNSEGDEHHGAHEEQMATPMDHENTHSPEVPTGDHHEQPTHDDKEDPKHEEATQKEVVNPDHPQEQHNAQNL